MPEDIQARVKQDHKERARTGRIGLKVNLYTDVDVDALGSVLASSPTQRVRLECLMVGDSLLTTHLGRATTRLRGEHERRWAFGLLREAVREVADAMRAEPAVAGAYLMADLPDGSLRSRDRLARASEGFLDAGADAVKVEVDGRAALEAVQNLAGLGVPAFAHLGFTPQSARLRRHGSTTAERRELYRIARAARDAGACGLILEMVDPTANAALSRPSPHGLPCFSIFSGPAVPGGGLSINAWDAVFRHPSGSASFPPTAFLDPAQRAERYGPGAATRGLAQLLVLVEQGLFPGSVPIVDTEDVQETPWLTRT